ADALDRFREELAIQMLAAGEYRRAAAGFEDMAARSTREGRISDAALGWSGVARCLNPLGALAQAPAACDPANALAARLAGPSMSSINIRGAMYEFAIADDGGWERLVSLAQAPPPEHQWAAVATMAAGARMCARLGRADDAMMLLESFLGPMEQAPDGRVIAYSGFAEAATTLWLLQRTDHAPLLERKLHEQVLAPDFRYPMQDGRLAMAYLRAVQGDYEAAKHWFDRARAVLDEQGARPLRAIVDFDEALMYWRR